MKTFLNWLAIILLLSLVYLPLFSGAKESKGALVLAPVQNLMSRLIPSYFKAPKPSPTAPKSITEDVSKEKKSSGKSYLSDVTEIWAKNVFNRDDFEKLMKDGNGKPLSVEELAKKAEILSMTTEIKDSLRIWQNFDKQIAEKLKSVQADNQYNRLHKSLVGWYEYHANYAGKLISGNLSRGQIKVINDDYFKTAKIYMPQLYGQLSIAEQEEQPFFYAFLGKIAQAAISPFYDFGGRVIYVDPCDGGVLVYLWAGVKSTVVGLPYGVWAINPYIYKMVYPGVLNLGKAFIFPFVCTKIGVPTGGAPFTVWYFGSSLVPGI